MNIEQLCMELILNSANAKDQLLSSMDARKIKDFKEERLCLQRTNDFLIQAHTIQTKLLAYESVETIDMKHMILLMHAQDHFMSIMTIRDIIERIKE